MSIKTLEEFYQQTILIAFNIKSDNILWQNHEQIGPDDQAHHFSINSTKYILVIRDYDVFSDKELQEILSLTTDQYKYVDTTFGENKLHVSLRLSSFNKYISGMTGTFVLLRID